MFRSGKSLSSVKDGSICNSPMIFCSVELFAKSVERNIFSMALSIALMPISVVLFGELSRDSGVFISFSGVLRLCFVGRLKVTVMKPPWSLHVGSSTFWVRQASMMRLAPLPQFYR